jgi:hypothetical protein
LIPPYGGSNPPTQPASAVSAPSFPGLRELTIFPRLRQIRQSLWPGKLTERAPSWRGWRASLWSGFSNFRFSDPETGSTMAETGSTPTGSFRFRRTDLLTSAKGAVLFGGSGTHLQAAAGRGHASGDFLCGMSFRVGPRADSSFIPAVDRPAHGSRARAETAQFGCSTQTIFRPQRRLVIAVGSCGVV